MKLETVLFFSGSILHEKALDGSERAVVGTRGDAIKRRLPELLDEPAPLPKEKPPSLNLQGWVERQQKHVRDVERWQQSEEAWGLAAEELRVAQELDEQLRLEYRRIMQQYCYLDYVACVQRYLSTFIAETSPAYLLNIDPNVVAQGTTRFKHYSPGTLPERASALQVSQRGRRLGQFARTASIAAWAEKYDWLCPKSVRFLKRVGNDEFDVIPAPAQRNDPPPHGWQWAQYQASVGASTEAVPNASSRVMKADFDAFIGEMLAANLGFPLFSISDCNSFHTSGYLWSTYAIRSVMAPGSDAAVAILNFDQHPDLGEGEPIGSDKWGKVALKTVNNGCYMSFGNAAKLEDDKYAWSTTFYVRKNRSTANAVGAIPLGVGYRALTPGQKVQYLTSLLLKTKSSWQRPGGLEGETLLADLEHGGAQKELAGGPKLKALSLSWIFSELWTALVADLGRPFEYVFITVDRDAIQGHQTQWGDASFFEDGSGLVSTIKVVVDTLLAACPGCRFIGLDITGLPEARVVYNQRSDILVPADDAWAKVADEIERLRQLGTRYANRHTLWEFAFVDAAHSTLHALTSALRAEGVARCLSVDLKSDIRELWEQLNRDYRGAMRLQAKAVELTTQIRDPLRRLAESLAGIVEGNPRLPERARSAFEGAAACILNAFRPQDHLRELTGQSGEVHAPRPKGAFKGKSTITFSLTGGGRRYY